MSSPLNTHAQLLRDIVEGKQGMDKQDVEDMLLFLSASTPKHIIDSMTANLKDATTTEVRTFESWAAILKATPAATPRATPRATPTATLTATPKATPTATPTATPAAPPA
eukprot:8481534-Heterocapsa_arctica.AAC.1